MPYPGRRRHAANIYKKTVPPRSGTVLYITDQQLSEIRLSTCGQLKSINNKTYRKSKYSKHYNNAYYYAKAVSHDIRYAHSSKNGHQNTDAHNYNDRRSGGALRTCGRSLFTTNGRRYSTVKTLGKTIHILDSFLVYFPQALLVGCNVPPFFQFVNAVFHLYFTFCCIVQVHV